MVIVLFIVKRLNLIRIDRVFFNLVILKLRMVIRVIFWVKVRWDKEMYGGKVEIVYEDNFFEKCV